MRRLTKPERDELVLDLYYNQNKTYRQIAKEARICPRDIGLIINKEFKDIESKQSLSKAARAYKLFSEGKSPREVAIALDLREPEVTQLYKESWNLTQLYDLNQMYLENKGNIAPLVKLYKLTKAAGLSPEHVVTLLRIANNDLPLMDYKYENLKTDVKTLEEYKRNSEGRLRDLNNQITEASNYVEYYKASCRQEETKMNILQRKRMKLEALVKQFENNNEEYIKIRKTAEEKILTTLSDRKGLLKLAFLCLTQSMRNEPEKYNSLIHYGGSSTTDYSRPYYGASYQSKNYGSEDYMAMLVEESDKLWNMLPKELVGKIITNYSNRNPFPLPLSPPPEGE
ncbi:MAG: hypothetical protein M3044_05030 [Thermoproteota archaeon]|nr:hypothetical protein [Thermoproteota archaeon]